MVNNNGLRELYNKLEESDKVIKQLENDTMVKLYHQNKIDNQNIRNEIYNLKSKIQQHCLHPIWYHISTHDDCYEGRRYFTCKCLECEFVEEDRSREFKNVVYLKEKFEAAQSKYYEIKDITNQTSIIKELLEEKFNRKDF